MKLVFQPSFIKPGKWFCKQIIPNILGSWVWPWEIRTWLQERIDETKT